MLLNNGIFYEWLIVLRIIPLPTADAVADDDGGGVRSEGDCGCSGDEARAVA